MEDLQNNFEQEEENELRFSDKLIGVISAPNNTFEKISNSPIKATDWLMPILVVIILSILSQFTLLNNPQIKQRNFEKTISQIDNNLQKLVDAGELTSEQKEEQLDKSRDQMEKMSNSGFAKVFSAIGIVVGLFIFFFIIAGFYYMIAKLVLKGEGGYNAAMVAYGLPYYIIALQVIFILIASVLLNRMLTGFDIASLLNMNKETYFGFILGKLDIFSIWFYAVVSIGFAKMFKSKSSTGYFVMVFGSWIGFSFIMFLLAKAVPFLSFFGM